MTMALLYRNNQEAFFIQDFRVTHQNGKQIDAAMKYESFGDRIGMFFAGNLAAIKHLLPRIRAVEADVTIDNILEPSGPLASTINLYMERNPFGILDFPRVGILGFIVDHDRNANVCFYVNASVGRGSLISGVPQNEVVVIGSGDRIDNIASRLTNIANQTIGKGYDIYSALDATRQHIKSLFQRVGVSAYTKLGISTIMAGSVLVNDNFSMLGEHITGERVSTDFRPEGAAPSIEYDFSFSRDDNGKIVLVNNITKEQIEIKEMESYVEGPSSDLFDPERLTDCFDPSRFISPGNVVYIISQWVISDKLVYRVVDKTTVADGMCHPDYDRLACCMVTPDMPAAHGQYILSGDCGLHILSQSQESFDQNISSHLFDHSWLFEHVQNYSDLYRHQDT